MKILVLVKESFHPETEIVLRDEKSIDDTGVRYIINPYDELAIEEALRLKEKFGGEVVVISLGRAEAENTLRNALALGADRANLIISEYKDALMVSKILAGNIQQEESYDLILSGWIAVDDNRAQVPGRISRLLEIPFVNVVTQIDIIDKIAICIREGDGLLEKVEVPLPAIIAVDKGINEPRLPAVMNILQANKIPVQRVTVPTFHSPGEEAAAYELPAGKRKGIIVKDVNANEAVSFLIKTIIDKKLI